MLYVVLAPIFFASLLIFAVSLILLLVRPRIYLENKTPIRYFLFCWFGIYFLFILFFTGPRDLKIYPSQDSAKYHLPWKAGVSRFVAQGNRSFTSHRDFHEFAWDFVMPNGTEILSARDGRVLEVDDGSDGIGYHSNVIKIQHEDGERSVYAHIKYKGALVQVGDEVKLGQPIALSGMVGQTVFPHVHFYVINKEGTASIPISFSEVPGGVPFAGHVYTSQNQEAQK